MKQPYVSVVIASLNGASKIATCLESLKKQTYPANRYEIIVVDDGSTDDTSGVAKTHGAHVITLAQNQGRAAARNAGWREAKGEWIAFTDDDCLASPDWIERLATQFSSDTVAVGGRIIGTAHKTLGERYLAAVGYGNPVPVAFGKSKNPLQRFMVYLASMFTPATLQTKPSYAQAIFTANAAYRRDVLEALGGFDPSLPTSEDTDLALRTHTHYPEQHIVFEPAATIAHAHERSIWRFAQQAFKRSRNTLTQYKKERKIPPIYPFPVIIFTIMFVSLIVAPWLVLVELPILPIGFYCWWLVRAIRDKSGYTLLFAYGQCLCESAEVAGLIAGFIRPNKDSTGIRHEA